MVWFKGSWRGGGKGRGVGCRAVKLIVSETSGGSCTPQWVRMCYAHSSAYNNTIDISILLHSRDNFNMCAYAINVTESVLHVLNTL